MLYDVCTYIYICKWNYNHVWTTSMIYIEIGGIIIPSIDPFLGYYVCVEGWPCLWNNRFDNCCSTHMIQKLGEGPGAERLWSKGQVAFSHSICWDLMLEGFIISWLSLILVGPTYLLRSFILFVLPCTLLNNTWQYYLLFVIWTLFVHFWEWAYQQEQVTTMAYIW